MGFFSKLFKDDNQQSKTPTIVAEKNTIYSPLSGTVITLEEINDGVFSTGVLGNGCGIKPSNETVVAPFDGEISMVADTKHAVGLTSTDGVEMLIHVGLDTVAMNGKGFQVFVQSGDKVKCGQKLLCFSKSAIKAAGFPDITAVLVSNSDDYAALNLAKTGMVQSLDKLITLKQNI